jgi:Excalibur calcium-binding domain
LTYRAMRRTCLLAVAMAAVGMFLVATPVFASQVVTQQRCDNGSGSVSQSSTASSDSDGGSVAVSSSSCGGENRTVVRRDNGDISQSNVQTQSSTSNEQPQPAPQHVHRTVVRRTTSRAVTCSDFDSQAAAQAFFNARPNSASQLDRDNDGRACETSRGVRSVPRSGVETGGGGTLHPHLARAASDPAVEAVKILGPLAVLLIVGGLFGLRRSRLG